jgi:uncharacterized protein YbjT (DUF2867 family)
MNILITGATGFIGNAILPALLQQGHKVTACSRYPEKLLTQSEHLTRLTIDFETAVQAEDWLPHLKNIDAVINCVGIISETKHQSFTQLHTNAPIALFTAAAQSGVQKIIQISALGADENAQSDYHLSKRAADDFLRGLDMDWFILQPSIVYGERAQSTAFFHALAALPVQVLPDGGGQLLQPIHIDDLVAVVCQCLESSANARQTLALVGPAPIRYADLLLNLRLRLGKAPAKTVNIPEKWLLHLAGLGKFLDTPILSKDNIPMLYRNKIGDPTAITRILGRPPLNIHQQLFAKPASSAERWHAHLYFLKSLLLLLITIVWLWSGITSLFFYPHQASYQLLAGMGVTGIAAPFALYGLALLDIGLGLATLARYRWQTLLNLQMAIVLVYTLVISMALPEFWLHPFGPILKNLPFLMVLWICAIISR